MSRVLTVLFDEQVFDNRSSAAIACGLFVAMVALMARSVASTAVHSVSARLGRAMIKPAFGGI